MFLINLTSQTVRFHNRIEEDTKFSRSGNVNVLNETGYLSAIVMKNPQGLGPFVLHPSTDQERPNLENMNHSTLVHFMKPVDPLLTEALNPHLQLTSYLLSLFS